MQRSSFASMQCPIARAIDQLVDPWGVLVLQMAFVGARTFQDFEQRLGIPPTTLTRRLSLLCKHGILARKRYQAHPPRDEYVLTDKGNDLRPVVLALAVWGNRWLMPDAPIARRPKRRSSATMTSRRGAA
jgi:DNA-binding HxlR family transcriptional regulator